MLFAFLLRFGGSAAPGPLIGQLAAPIAQDGDDGIMIASPNRMNDYIAGSHEWICALRTRRVRLVIEEMAVCGVLWNEHYSTTVFALFQCPFIHSFTIDIPFSVDF